MCDTHLPVVKKENDELIEKIVNTQDPSELKDLTNAFNMFQTKRQILRGEILNDTQDELLSLMQKRIQEYPDNFNNSDLVNWYKTMQQAYDANQSRLDRVDELPQITYQNNTQINLNISDSLSRDSKDRIKDALDKILHPVEEQDTKEEIEEEEESER